MNKNHYVAIMAGGIGTRFWPMSRTSFPKQFLDILGTGKTLIQQTFDRFADFIPKENIYIITSNEYIPIVKKQLPEASHENILGEPSRKNTAPCVAYIAHKLNHINPEGCLICAPADHLVLEHIAFKKVCIEALNFVRQNNALVTLGIKPTHPNTGYGYIQHEQFEVSDNVYKVKTFTEKPTLEIAKTFLSSGDFLWNAGISEWLVQYRAKTDTRNNQPGSETSRSSGPRRIPASPECAGKHSLVDIRRPAGQNYGRRTGCTRTGRTCTGRDDRRNRSSFKGSFG